MEKVTELLQDPRPLDEKQQLVFQEIQDTMVEFLERGVSLETEVLSNVKSNLPPEMASVISDLVPEPPMASADTYAPSSSYDMQAPSAAADVQAEETPYTFTAESVAANQVRCMLVDCVRGAAL